MIINSFSYMITNINPIIVRCYSNTFIYSDGVLSVTISYIEFNDNLLYISSLASFKRVFIFSYTSKSYFLT